MLRSGVVLISGGVVLIGSGRARASARSMGLALGVGLLVAAYVTIDGLGVRLAGGALSYTVWICIVYGAVMPLTYRLVSGRFAGGLITRDGVTATAGGIFSLVSYGAMVSALALGPLAPVSALRDLSVVFSVRSRSRRGHLRRDRHRLLGMSVAGWRCDHQALGSSGTVDPDGRMNPGARGLWCDLSVHPDERLAEVGAGQNAGQRQGRLL
jgi:hypothetical protein